MRDENQQAFGRGGRVRGRAAPLLAGARLIPVGHVRLDDLMGYVAYQQPRFGAERWPCGEGGADAVGAMRMLRWME